MMLEVENDNDDKNNIYDNVYVCQPIKNILSPFISRRVRESITRKVNEFLTNSYFKKRKEEIRARLQSITHLKRDYKCYAYETYSNLNCETLKNAFLKEHCDD
jgi:hypothetical protein